VKKLFIIAGERSGDLHGGNLIKALKAKDESLKITCWGGNAMQQAGADLRVHYRELAFMGVWEVIQNLGTIRKLISRCKEEIMVFKPDAVVLIDYPGFNLRIAKFARKMGIRVFYYISPKVWAWNTKRAWKIKKNVDHLFSILPFEKDFYQQFNYEVDYVGNPLLDAIRNFSPDPGFIQENQVNNPVIAVLPGSREQEVENMLGLMLSILPYFPHYTFAIAAVNNLPASLYDTARAHSQVKIFTEKTYDILSIAEAALVTSGTATLETALFQVPQVVCYRISHFSYVVMKQFIQVPYISLVNLIAGRKMVTELIQDELNEARLKQELESIVTEGPNRENMLADYKELKEIIGNYRPSEQTATLMLKYLEN
jgi:lipid-A-disaccharide synthase